MQGPATVLLDAAAVLPHHRVPTGRHGLVATGGHDEDVVTMAAEAGLALLEGVGEPPAALVLATVSGPFAEGGNAQVLAEVLDLAGDDLVTLEVGGSVAAGGGALVIAATLAGTGGGPVLVLAADRRRDARGRALGDAAVAMLLAGDADRTGEWAGERAGDRAAARIVHLGSGTDLVRDRWRRTGEAATRTAERSFVRQVAGAPGAAGAVTVSPTGPGLPRVGDAGCAGLGLAVLVGLDDGDRHATVTASGVTHRFHVSPGPAAGRVAAATRAVLEAGVEDAPAADRPRDGFDPYASQPRAWRDRAQDLRLVGQRDPATGEVLYPPVPARAADGLEPARLGRRGRVLTATRDHIVPLGAPLTMAVVAVDGGGRFYGPVADGHDVAIDDRVELVLRRLHDGGGLPQWFWKVRPDPVPPRSALSDTSSRAGSPAVPPADPDR